MSREPLALIVAVSENGVIGRNGGLPWRIPEDLAYFKRTTMGHAVIMGRKTWDEVGKPLPGRRNIVVSSNPSLLLTGAEVVGSVDAAIAKARDTDAMPFVIGGAEIFRIAMPQVTRIHWTEVMRSVEGDTHFPPFDATAFHEVERTEGSGVRWIVLERN